MCRLFGFRSVIPSQVHTSLVSAENALMLQSNRHPDGWGVAYYVAGSPHIIKSASSAIDDSLFHHVSGIVSSQTVLAHIRKATQGKHSIINTHPFQYGSWTFAHNGNLKKFSKHCKLLRSKISPHLRRFILGHTDSEVLFYLLLTYLSRQQNLHSDEISLSTIVDAIRKTVDDVCSVVGECCSLNDGDPSDTYLSFILSNGKMMIAHHGGKDMYYSTYKHRCSVRDQCPNFSIECEHPSINGFVNHLIFSSEPLQGENVWLKMSQDQIVGVDLRMILHQFD